MPTLSLPIPFVVRELEDSLYLHEVLHSPEIRILQTQERLSTVQSLSQTLLSQVKRHWLHERLAETPAELQEQTVEVSLPRGPHTPWTSPLLLSFLALTWKTGSGQYQALVPDLELELLEPSLEALQQRIPGAILEALARKRLTQDFFGLQQTQRTVELTLRSVSRPIELPSPLELQRSSQAQGGLSPSKVLQEVAQDASLLSELPSECFEQEELQARLLEILQRSPKRSILLVGPAGVGKSVLFRSVLRQAGRSTLPVSPYFTSGARLVAGMSGFGQWQERCLNLVKEAPSTTHLLHLGHLIELMDSGKSAHSQENIAGFLLNYIARGEIRVVVEATPEALAVIERQLPRAIESLEVLRVLEPSPEATRRILTQVLARLPEPVPELPPRLLERIERLHSRFATTSCRPGRPLRFLTHLVEDARFEPAPGYVDVAPVTEAIVLSAFSRDTGLPRWVIDPSIPFEADAHRAWLAARVVGQAEAIDAVLEVLTTLKAGLQRPGRPLASFLCIGPTGVGKTQLARSLAEMLFQSPDRLVRFDMSEYAHPLAADRLVGGIQGKEGLLTARVREQPFSVILLDELEKADSGVFDLLLQILGEGRLTDGAGRVADFCNTLILMTSNLGVASYRPTQTGFSGAAKIERAGLDPQHLAQQQRKRTAEHFVREVEKFIRPELFNRLDRILAFQPLSQETLHAIVGRELAAIRERTGLKQRPILLDIPAEVQDWLAIHGYDARYGARPLKRLIERALLHPLATKLLEYQVTVPVRAQVKASGSRLEVEVAGLDRDQLQKALAAGHALTTPEALELQLFKVQELRTFMSRLSAGGPAHDLRNEATRVQREHGILKARIRKAMLRLEKPSLRTTLASAPKSQADEIKRIARLEAQEQNLSTRLEKLRTLTQAITQLTNDIHAQESDLLLSLLGESVPGALLARPETLKERFEALLYDLYRHHLPGGERVSLLLLSEEPEVRVKWTQRYVRILEMLGLSTVVRRVSILAGPAAKGTKRAPIPELSKYTLFTDPEGPYVVGTPSSMATDPALLASQGILGAMLEVTGPKARLYLDEELGRHVIRPQDPRQPPYSLVIQVVPAPPEKLVLPPEVARQGALDRYPEKRRYLHSAAGVTVIQGAEATTTPDLDSALKEILVQTAQTRLYGQFMDT